MTLKLYLCSSLLAVAVASTAAAQSSDWTSHIMEGNRLVAEHKYAEAEIELKAAVKAADEIKGGGSEPGVARNNLGIFYQRIGSYREAIRHHVEAVAILQKIWGPQDKFAIQAARNLAIAYVSAGEPSKAEKLIRELMPEEEKVTDPNKAVLLTILAQVAFERNQFDQTERMLREALEVLDRQPGKEYRESVAVTLAGLAWLCSVRGRNDEALRYAETATTMLDDIQQAYPVTLIGFLGKAATMYARQGDKYAAEHLFHKAILMAENVGPEHPVLAQVLYEYASYLARTGRKGEARSAENRAAAIRTESDLRNMTRDTVDVQSLVRQH